jgi:ATP-dependent Lon protease
VVITDLKMASLDGMELLEKIGGRFPDIKVIVVTGFATISSAIEAVKKGAFDYIAKPFKLDEVRNAVRKALEKRAVVKNTKGSVLCFSGPPGTGKTSVGRAVAQALGRKFTRIALGGMKDEADIRGHRRTYVGAKPGRIIEEIHRLETTNPVIMLDELDKLGHDVKGDPASALLEVLDPEQNQAFVDHYLDVPFDLSSVMFIVTANLLDTIHAPLRDRMEVIEFPGYTQEEKAQIATRFLVPKQIREKGLSTNRIGFAPEAVQKVIQEYTREAGIRSLERKIATICRKIAKESLQNSEDGAIRVTPEQVEHFLGKRKYQFEVIEEQDRIGVTTGLVWTGAGGDIIFVEAARMKGDKELIITGSLARSCANCAGRAELSGQRSLRDRRELFNARHPYYKPGAPSRRTACRHHHRRGAPVAFTKRLPGDVHESARSRYRKILPVGGIRKALAAKRARWPSSSCRQRTGSMWKSFRKRSRAILRSNWSIRWQRRRKRCCDNNDS